MLGFLIILVLPFLGWFVGVKIYDLLTKNTTKKDVFITHNHYDNRQVHFHATPPEENHQLD
jgi:hypothetical protein